MFNYVFMMSLMMFVLVFGMILFVVFQGVSQWHSNNKAPIVQVDAKVVSKNIHISRSSSRRTISSFHYVTFEDEKGNRQELCVPRQEYGLLVEGDLGTLTLQGTRFLGFERRR